MLRKVIVRTVSNAPKFAPAEWEFEFEVGCCLRIETKFFRTMVTKSEVFFFDSEGKQPLMTESSPVIEPFEVRSRFTEEFKFHLFKFAHTENKVARCDFVTERFSDLSDSERNFLS